MKMADDTFELLTRMYADFSAQFKEIKADIKELKSDVSELKVRVTRLESEVAELKSEVAELKSDVSELKSEVSTLKKDMAKLSLKLENETNRKIDLLFETRVDGNRRFEVLESKMEAVSVKVDKHEIEIKALKAVQ